MQILDESPQPQLRINSFRQRARFYVFFILLVVVFSGILEFVGQYYGKNELGLLASILGIGLGSYWFVRYFFRPRSWKDQASGTFMLLVVGFSIGGIPTAPIFRPMIQGITSSLFPFYLNSHFYYSLIIAFTSSCTIVFLVEVSYLINQ
ncbi:MAG: hypothetical protein GY810_15400 [Aureispira sp.]|nr:hypothetical protein [Aureispira sp.]